MKMVVIGGGSIFESLNFKSSNNPALALFTLYLALFTSALALFPWLLALGYLSR
jgi:hypothetical protein